MKKYITVSLCSIFILFFSFWCFFISTPAYSESERRKLAEFPSLTWQSATSGEFAKQFEEYTTDRFPLRDTWRSMKAYTRLYALMQKENNDLFIKDGHISKIEYPLNEEMLEYSVSLFTKIHQTYLQQNNAYIAVIPDKNKYLAELTLDYESLNTYLYDGLPFCTPIQIDHLLSAEDYYFTDSHWRQDQITDVAEYITQSMGTELKYDYTSHTLDREFFGVYAGQSALNRKPDTITYLTNDTIDRFEVTGADAVYDMKKASGKDAYELFLSGNQPLVTIRNPQNTSGKKLIVFRDSFASSLMPLLAQGYSEVTMIDLRYIHSQLLGKFVDFSQADVLFLYSAGVLNHSTSMK